MNILVHIYAVHAFPESPADAPSAYAPLSNRDHVASDSERHGNADAEALGDYGYSKTNGHGKLNGHANGVNGSAGLSDRERRHVRGAEDFELDEMVSEDDDDEHIGRKEGAVRM